jgi:hypothetical protein
MAAQYKKHICFPKGQELIDFSMKGPVEVARIYFLDPTLSKNKIRMNSNYQL